MRLPAILTGTLKSTEGNYGEIPRELRALPVEGDVDPLHEAERISRYEIVRKLGEGGMGVVYQARDTDLGRFVALKFITHHAMSAPESIARFRKEARAISALNHTRIATIYGIEETNDSKFLVLEYLPGGTLRQKLLALGRFGLLGKHVVSKADLLHCVNPPYSRC